MADYTRWYRVGTVALTKNSKTVTGSGTYWLSAGLNPGDLFTVDASQFYEVNTINSNTELTLKTAYSGNTTSETDYSIVRNFTAQLPAQVAAQTADLLNDFRRYVDADMQSIHGKSAYQIACDKGYAGTESQWVESLKGDSAYTVAVQNGYTGTQAEWLESLKAAQEWSAADTRISALEGLSAELFTANGAPHRNSIYRGKNLGTFTDDHYKEITSGRFTDMYVGDYFTIDATHKYYIGGFNRVSYVSSTLMLVSAQGITEAEAAPYANTRMAGAIGTEGEEGYIPAAYGEYMETNWYVNLRPKFIEQVAGFFGGENRLVEFSIDVPTAHANAGNMTSWVVSKSKAHLPTIEMVEGTAYYRSSWNLPCSWMHALTQSHLQQLPLFYFNQKLRGYMCAETIARCFETSYDEYFAQFCNYVVLWPNHQHMKGAVKPVFCIG